MRGYGFFTFCLSPVGNAVRLPGRKNPKTNFSVLIQFSRFCFSLSPPEHRYTLNWIVNGNGGRPYVRGGSTALCETSVHQKQESGCPRPVYH